jgi:hypothetical protein
MQDFASDQNLLNTQQQESRHDSSGMPPGSEITSDQTTPHSLETQQKGSTSMKRLSPATLVLALVVIVAGIGTGVGVAKLQGKTQLMGNSGQPLQQVAGNNIKAGDVFGVQDEKTFKDSADGYLEAGGVDGEGSHRLIREGGESQTVYLTSSVTDLDKFIGMNVKVWGETFKAQKAGWLMDVGRVQIVNPQGQPPAENE